jgi:hypothetical protein
VSAYVQRHSTAGSLLSRPSVAKSGSLHNDHGLRREPLEGRKATLEMILAKAGPGIRFNEHMEGDGETVFRHACKLGLEGKYAAYYNESRIHRSLNKDAPFLRTIEHLGVITSRPVLGGLHHQYCRI